MSNARAIHRVPNHVQLTDFMASLLPFHQADVPFTYHSPRNRGYDPQKGTIDHVVLSITPTPGVYEKLQKLAEQSRRKPACFLHRPFNLDRRSVPRGSIILASHKRFDELLTVGYNTVLAERLGLDVEAHVLIQGYKNDPERRMGIVASLRTRVGLTSIIDVVRKEFGTCEVHAGDGDPSIELNAVAIVNAFNPEMIARVATAATTSGWTTGSDMSQVLFLTGEGRETGFRAAKEMPVACVGHRAAEEWGIRWLASQLRLAFPTIQVSEIFEDEEELSKMGEKQVDVAEANKQPTTKLI
jgi:putative NIF3 family GTP cyclohydrolase 1 type 2